VALDEPTRGIIPLLIDDFFFAAILIDDVTRVKVLKSWVVNVKINQSMVNSLSHKKMIFTFLPLLGAHSSVLILVRKCPRFLLLKSEVLFMLLSFGADS
jgi:hypothetical protein